MITLDDLVANGTMSREIADLLRRTVAERRSFLVFARPRLAGKTTTMRAMLAVRGAGVPVRTVGEDGDDVEALGREARDGYLVVPEITKYPVAPGYVWGAPVRAAFAATDGGCALAAVLHADDPRTALAIVARNGVPTERIARLAVLVHLRSLGPDPMEPTGRRVAGVHAVNADTTTRPLFLWDEARDRFDAV
ncbi:MAG TPA: hypothetical protein VFM93_09540 [Candidatus Limnocylindria bacterium]|nr:hypothetical protein [Candidatus Limnocylindria bacterium]